MTQAKTMRGWLIGNITKFSRNKQKEYEVLFKSILEKYNEFHPQRTGILNTKSWKGKSSFEIFTEEDKIIIRKYKRKDKDSIPEAIETEINFKELKTLMRIIKRLYVPGNPLKTKHLARVFCNELEIYETNKGKKLIEGNFWDNFFSWRAMHNKFTLMLGALDYAGFIKYSGGNTVLLNNKMTFQEVLK